MYINVRIVRDHLDRMELEADDIVGSAPYGRR
jgi:hypothetical protein